MSHDHSHDPSHEHHRHESDRAVAPSPGTPAHVDDAGSRALADALSASFVIVKFIMAGLIVLFFASGVFIVPPQEKAVVFRLGKPLGTGEEQLLGPGLHWSFPAPIDEIVRIPVGQIQTLRSTAGWFAVTPEQEAAGTDPDARMSLNPAVDGYTLTADGNIIHVRATLRYRITDPLAYALNFVNASNVVQHALDNALFYASSQFEVDRALRLDRAAFKERIVSRVNDLINEQKLGITLEPVDLQVRAPLSVKSAFDQVLAAEQERSMEINKAQGDANAMVSKAEGEAKAILNQGEADRARLVQTAASEAQYLENRLAEFKRNPDLFHQRLLTDTFHRVLTNAQDKFFLPERAEGGTRELRLLLNREPEKPAAPPSPGF